MRTLSLALAAALALTACGDADAPGAPGSAEVPPTPPSTRPTALAARLPETVDGRPRQSLDTTTDQALGAEVSRVSADYGPVSLTLTDFGTAEMAEMMGHGWGAAAGAETLAGRPVQRDRLTSTVRVMVGGRYLAEAEAETVDQAESALAEVSLDGLGG